MKYLKRNFMKFKRYFRKKAEDENIDLDFYLDNDDYITIYFTCLLQGFDPVKLTIKEINDILVKVLFEAKNES